MSSLQDGYMMASVIVLGTALSVLCFAMFDYSNSARTVMDRELYVRMANDAAQSGIEYAFEQVASNPNYTGSDAPTTCSNGTGTQSPYLTNDSQLCTTFKLQEVSEGKFLATGYVMRKLGGASVLSGQYKYSAVVPGAAAAAYTSSAGPIDRVQRVNVSTPGSTAYGTGSFTPSGTFSPQANRLLITTVVAGENCTGSSLAANGASLNVSGGGLTWIPITGATRNSSNAPCDVSTRSFYAIVGNSPPSSMQVTVDASGNNMYAYTVGVHEYNNVDLSAPVAGAISGSRSNTSNGSWSIQTTATPTNGDMKIQVTGLQSQDLNGSGNSGFLIPNTYTNYLQTIVNPVYGPTTQLNSVRYSTSTYLNYQLGTLRTTQDTVYSGYIIKQNPASTASTGAHTAFSSTTGALAREGQATVNNGNYMYNIGGCDTSGAKTATVQYAPINTNGTLGTWSTTTALPTTNCNTAATIYNGRIYVGGGNSTGAIYYATINANGTVGSWSTYTLSSMANLYLHDMQSFNGYLYVIGGAYNYSTKDYDIVYMPISATTGAPGTATTQTNWLGTTTDPYCTTTAIANDKMYVYSRGKIRWGQIAQTGGSISTSTTTSTPASKDCASLVSTGHSFMYLLGGSQTNTVYYTQATLTGALNSWTLSSNSLPGNRSSGGATAVNRTVYYLGGDLSGTAQNNSWYMISQ